MIKIYLGNVGSGKTACAVREMFMNENHRKTYSNILVDLPHVIPIKAEMIIKKEQIGEKKNKSTGDLTPIYEYKLNKEFWIEQKDEPKNIIIDEAHSIINSRRSMSKINIIVTDWLALIRRFLGQTESGYGNLIFISQLEQRIDVIAREMCNEIHFHICHYDKVCHKCEYYWTETNETPRQKWNCPACGHQKVIKCNHRIEVLEFSSMLAYTNWKMFGDKTYYLRYLVTDIENYFNYYDTLQIANMLTEF